MNYILRNVSTYCSKLCESKWQCTFNNKLREIKNNTNSWPKPQTFNHKDDQINDHKDDHD